MFKNLRTQMLVEKECIYVYQKINLEKYIFYTREAEKKESSIVGKTQGKELIFTRN